MTYELSKQLKDAGFPQKLHPFTGLMYEETSPNIPIHCANDKGCYCPEHTGEPYVVIPTLSELIEALGDKFYQLTNGQAGFIAFSYPEFGEHYGEGKTPEEAVAKLWLALNTNG